MNEIEKKIYDAGRLHAINQSSEKILEAFKTKHPHRIQKRFIFIPTITTLLASAVATAFIFIINPKPLHIEGTTKGLSDGSTVLTSLVSDLSIHHYINNAGGVQNRAFNLGISQEEFEKVATDIDAVYSPYSYYENHAKGFNYSFDSTRFSFDNVMYKYQLSVNNTLIYLKDNISEIKERGTYVGLISLNDNCYPCEINAKATRNVVSTSFVYRVDTCLHTLSHHELNEKTIITHQMDIDGQLAKNNSVALSNVNNTFTASFVNDDKLTSVEKERSFIHEKNASTITINYSRRQAENPAQSYDGIKLKLDSKRSTIHTYSYDGVDDVII